jgi:hypothetical protein
MRLEEKDCQTLLMAVEKTETTEENIQFWLELDGDLGFQLLVSLHF